jgi:ferredoxin-NADP reductase
MMQGRIALVDGQEGVIRKFRIALDETFSFIAGQYVMITFPGEDDKHAFSVVEHDPSTNTATLLIKKHGPFTERLFSSGEGQVLDVYGPYGRFILPEEHKELVFIAGGIGITPLYSMMKQAVKSGYGKKIRLFYTTKTKDSMALYSELSMFKHENIEIELNFSADGKRLLARDLPAKVPDMDSCLYYICGPLPMIESFRNDLKGMGVDEEMIRSEEFK